MRNVDTDVDTNPLIFNSFYTLRSWHQIFFIFCKSFNPVEKFTDFFGRCIRRINTEYSKISVNRFSFLFKHLFILFLKKVLDKII